MANGNGNTYMKPILIGVAVFVLGAAIVGAAGNTFSNSLDLRSHIESDKVETQSLKRDVAEQKQATKDIPVMAEQIKDIKDDVRKILEKLEK